MTKKERLLQDIQYAIDNKIDRFYMKTEIYKEKGLTVAIHPLCNLKKIKKDIEEFYNDDLIEEGYRIVSWGEFSIHETKYIKDVVLGNELGEDIYD